MSRYDMSKRSLLQKLSWLKTHTLQVNMRRAFNIPDNEDITQPEESELRGLLYLLETLARDTEYAKTRTARVMDHIKLRRAQEKS